MAVVVINLAVNAAIGASLAWNMTGNFSLGSLFGNFRSGKSNDFALQSALIDISEQLSDVQDGITALENDLEEVGGLVEHSINLSYAERISELNTQAKSMVTGLFEQTNLNHANKQATVAASRDLLEDAIADIGALAIDPNASAQLLAMSAYTTLTNALAARVAVVKKYSDTGLGFSTINQQIEDAATLLWDVYKDGGHLEQRIAEEVVTTIEMFEGYTTSVWRVTAEYPDGSTRVEIVADSSVFNTTTVLGGPFGELEGQTVTKAASDPYELAHNLANFQMAEDFAHLVQFEVERQLDVFGAYTDTIALTHGTAMSLGSADDTEVGTDHADYMDGGEGGDDLRGGDGDDAIHGGEGMDDLRGGNGNDKVYGGLNGDDIRGEGGDDILEGNEGYDKIWGGNRHDVIYQSSEERDGTSNNTATGGVIKGGRGNDDIYGDDGNDNLFGGSGHDLIFGRGGNDSISGGAGDDNILGGDGNDNIDGGAGDDLIEGGAGADILRGGAGDDMLSGGAGINLIFGGEGNDTARINGNITQYDFAQLEDGTLAIFGAPGHDMPVYLIARTPGSLFDDGVETLEFNDYAINNHWNAGTNVGSTDFGKTPKEPSSPFEWNNDLTIQKDPIEFDIDVFALDKLTISELAKAEDRFEAVKPMTARTVENDPYTLTTADEFLF